MTVSLSSAQGHPGEQVQLGLSLTGSAQVSACQFNIPLPEGLTYVEGSAALDDTRATATHQLSVGQTGNTLTILVHSIQLDVLQGTSGELLHFSLLLGSLPGDHELQPAAVLSDPQGNSVGCGTPASAVVTILSPKATIGEAAVDFGRIPIRSTYTKPFAVTNTGNEPLQVTGFDCSATSLSVSPLTATIAAGQMQTFTLSYSPELPGDEQASVTVMSNGVGAAPVLSVVAQPFSVNELAVGSASGGSGDEVAISVSVQNMEPLVAAQCSFLLPPALQYVEGSATMNAQRSDGHVVMANPGGQNLTFFVYSPTNVALKESSGELFSFLLKLVGTGGTYPLTPEDVILSTTDGRDMTSGYQGGEVHIAAPEVKADTLADFGRMPMERPITASVSLNNTGEQPLVIERIVFTDSAFSVSGSLSETIAPGAAATIAVQYQASDEGPFSGTMLIYTNDPDTPMVTVALCGTAYITNELQLGGRLKDGQPEQYQLNIGLQNTTPVVAMQFDVHWQPGMVTSETSVSFSGRAAGHQVVVTHPDSVTCRFYVYSMSNTPINPGGGDVLSILYNNVSENQTCVGSTISVDGIVLSTADERNCASASASSLEVWGSLGDVNGDGYISIVDVVAIVAYALGQEPEDCQREQADLNRDGLVDATDVVLAVNLLLKEKY